MKTRWFTGSSRRKCSTWSRISEARRLRPNFIAPVAQNVHVSGQPDCEETQIERRPSRYRINTASTGCPSAVRKSTLTVPSADWASSSTESVEKRHRVGELVAERARQVRHLFVAGDATRSPLPHLAGAEGRLTASGERLVKQSQVDRATVAPVASAA